VSPDVIPWTAEELFAVAHEAGRYEPLVIWLGLMGTRWAEAIGLERHKIRNGVARIDSTLSEVNGRFHRVPTKTFVARSFPLPGIVQQHLEQLGPELLFTTSHGNPVRSAAFRSRVFLPAIQRAGVRPLHIHGLRHTCASLLASQGAPPKVIQAWLGHQDLRTTMSIYTHAFSADVVEAAQRFDALMGS
jgi:integrase